MVRPWQLATIGKAISRHGKAGATGAMKTAESYAADLATLIDRVEVKANDTQDEDILQLVRLVRVALMQSFIDRIENCGFNPGRKTG